MRSRSVVAGVLIGLLCATAGCDVAAPSATSVSTGAARSPDASVGTGLAEAPPSAAPRQPSPPSRPDWSPLFANSAGNYSGAQSLDEAAAQSELVIAGRLNGLEPWKRFGNGESVGWYAIAAFEVESVLHGSDVAIGDTVMIPFLITLGTPGSQYPKADLDAIRASLPEESALLFVVSWATVWDRTDTDVPEWLADLDRYDLFRTIGADGLFALLDGAIADQEVSDVGYPRWARDLTGLSLTEVQDLIRSGASG